MNGELLQSPIKQIPLTYIYHKAIRNRRGKAEDFIVLSTNSAFEQKAGLIRESVLGRKISQVFPDMGAESGWLSALLKEAMKGPPKEIEAFVDLMDGWYRVTGFSLAEDYLVTTFQEMMPGQEEEGPAGQGGSRVAGTILELLFERCPEIEMHVLKVKEYCLLLSDTLGLSSAEKDELSLFALYHDIGKIGVRTGIMRKPAPLTGEEWIEMRRHPKIGCHIARNTPGLSGICDKIHWHHERWDGCGYPDGLFQKEIPLMCRILSVADAYDAMITGRVYREKISPEEAEEELKRNAGRQFDPELVDLFIKELQTDKKGVL